jgi:hypothetical protein
VDGGSSKIDLPDVLSGIFFAQGLDTDRSKQATDLPVGRDRCNHRPFPRAHRTFEADPNNSFNGDYANAYLAAISAARFDGSLTGIH